MTLLHHQKLQWMKTALCKLVMDEFSEVIIIIITFSHLNKLEGGVLYLRVRVIEMEVEEVKDLSLVHLTPADLVVLKLVSVKSWIYKKLEVLQTSLILSNKDCQRSQFLKTCPVFGVDHLQFCFGGSFVILDNP